MFGLDSETIKALQAAGITGYLLVGLIFGLLSFTLAWLILRNRGKKTDSDAAVMTALTNAITTLTTNITTITQAMQEMQTGARKRDLQFDKMNDIQEKANQATTDQNNKLDRLITETISGREFYQKMTEEYIGGTKDTGAAIRGLDKRVEDKSGEIIDKLTAIHTDVKGVPQGVIDLIDWDMVSDRIKQAVGPIVADALSDCLKLTEEQAQEIDDTQEKLDAAKRAGLVPTTHPDDDPPSPDHKAPLPGDSGVVVTLPRVATDEQLKDAA